MKEFSEYLRGIPNGDGTEKEIKNYSKQMGRPLFFFSPPRVFSRKFIGAMKETCLFILRRRETNDLLSCARVSLQPRGH